MPISLARLGVSDVLLALIQKDKEARNNALKEAPKKA
jgi:hypothetical protein